MKIIAFIPFGIENAISNAELAVRAGKSERYTRQAVFSTRKQGEIICSVCKNDGIKGYYRPLSADEAIPYVRMQKSRILLCLQK